MFFDPAREVVVLVGVPEAGGYGRHWEWDGVKWRNMGAVADVRRTYFAVAYDHARQTVVVHGGIQNGTYVADTVEAELGFVSADCDADCDADLLDFAVLQTCAGDMSADAACAQLDVDGSGWVDAADFAELFAMPTGPSEPLD
jgi:hypothetical protein